MKLQSFFYSFQKSTLFPIKNTVLHQFSGLGLYYYLKDTKIVIFGSKLTEKLGVII